MVLPKSSSQFERINRKTIWYKKVELIKGTGGVFEVSVNDNLLYSKKDLGGFPNENEVEDLIEGIESVT